MNCQNKTEAIFQLGNRNLKFNFMDKVFFWLFLLTVSGGGIFLAWGSFDDIFVLVIFLLLFNGFFIFNFFTNSTSLTVFEDFIEVVYTNRVAKIYFKDLKSFKVIPAGIGSFIEFYWETNNKEKGRCAYMLSVKEEMEGTKRLANELERAISSRWKKGKKRK